MMMRRVLTKGHASSSYLFVSSPTDGQGKVGSKRRKRNLVGDANDDGIRQQESLKERKDGKESYYFSGTKMTALEATTKVETTMSMTVTMNCPEPDGPDGIPPMDA